MNNNMMSLLFFMYLLVTGVICNYTVVMTEESNSTITEVTTMKTTTTTQVPDYFDAIHGNGTLYDEECLNKAKEVIPIFRYLHHYNCLCRGVKQLCDFYKQPWTEKHRLLREDLDQKAEEMYPGMTNRSDTQFLYWVFYGQFLEKGFTIDELTAYSFHCFNRYEFQPLVFVKDDAGQTLSLAACMCYHQLAKTYSRFCDMANVTISDSKDLVAIKNAYVRDGYNRLRRTLVRDSFNKYFTFHVILLVFYGIIFLLGLIGNTLVVVTIFGFLPRDNVTNIFLANQSISDLLVIVFVLPMSIFLNVLKYVFVSSEVLCRSVWGVYFLGVFLTILSQMAMALERYLVICHPMKAQYVSTSSRARKIVVLVWFIAIALSAFPTYLHRLSQDDTDGIANNCYMAIAETVWNVYSDASTVTTKKSWRALSKNYYMIITTFLIPVSVMCFTYTKCGYALYSSVKDLKRMTGAEKQSDPGTQGANAERKAKLDETKSRIQVVKMLIAILIVFVATWLPGLIYETLTSNWLIDRSKVSITGLTLNEEWSQTQDYQRKVLAATFLLSIGNSAINPILYAFLSRSFRQGFFRCFAKFPCCKNLIGKYKAEASSRVSKSKSTGISTVSKQETSTGPT